MNASSEGTFGRCGMPAAVSAPPDTNRELGSRPTSRSVPGPWKCSASNPWSVMRSAVATMAPMRCSHDATASSSSSRQTRSTSDQSSSSAASGSMSGCTTAAQTGDGLGPTVQFTSRSLTAFSHSVFTGELSLPSRSGSRPARIEGSVPPDRLMIAHLSAAAARACSYDQVVA